MTSGEQLPSKRGLTSGRPTDYKTNANFAICTELLYDCMMNMYCMKEEFKLSQPQIIGIRVA